MRGGVPAGIWKVKPSDMAAYNSQTDMEKTRSVLDYSATNFLTGSWNDTFYMSPDIQNQVFDPHNPDEHFPDNSFYSWPWMTPRHPPFVDTAWMEPKDNSMIRPNDTGITMEMWQMSEVCRLDCSSTTSARSIQDHDAASFLTVWTPLAQGATGVQLALLTQFMHAAYQLHSLRVCTR